jgi:CRP/FNR family transcriptional regulator, cyclic AMP receptor protein
MESCKIDNKFLYSHSLFGGLTEVELDEIRTHFKEEQYKAGDLILHEGESNNKLYFIISGSVTIVRLRKLSNKHGEEETVVLSNFVAGDTFGEMELIDIQPCAASVRADTDTVVYTFTNNDLYQLSKWNHKTHTMIIMNLAREISRRLRVTNELLSYELYKNITE